MFILHPIRTIKQYLIWIVDKGIIRQLKICRGAHSFIIDILWLIEVCEEDFDHQLWQFGCFTIPPTDAQCEATETDEAQQEERLQLPTALIAAFCVIALNWTAINDRHRGV